MKRFLFVVFFVISILACGGTPTPPTESPPSDTGSSGGSDSDSGGDEQPAGQPELYFVSLWGETDATGAWLVAEIGNKGTALADGFWMTCDYNCPGGGTSYSGVGFVSGGIVPANDMRVYRNPFTAGCNPQPSSISVTCEIGGIAESNMGNNFATTMIPLP